MPSRWLFVHQLVAAENQIRVSKGELMPGADIEKVCNLCHPPSGQPLKSFMLLSVSPERHMYHVHPEIKADSTNREWWREYIVNVHW